MDMSHKKLCFYKQRLFLFAVAKQAWNYTDAMGSVALVFAVVPFLKFSIQTLRFAQSNCRLQNDKVSK